MLGIGCIIIAALWIPVRKFENHIVDLMDWLYTTLFIVYGIVYTIEGFGVAFLSLLGKAYVVIDQDGISIKTGIFDKAQKILWNAISSIDYHPLSFHVHRLNNTDLKLKLSGMDYSLIQEIKKVVGFIANEKGIPVLF